MWLMALFTPNLALPLPPRIAAALALAVMGFLVIALAVKGFRNERTSVNPMDLDRTSTVVTSGIYRMSRNPMYLGMLLCLLGFGCLLGNPFSLAAAVLFVPAITRLQIIPEERAPTRPVRIGLSGLLPDCASVDLALVADVDVVEFRFNV